MNGAFDIMLPISRMSWARAASWIILPQAMNRRALKIACIRRWKKASSTMLEERENVIIPNCLKVDRATVFFRFVSRHPEMLAIIDVIKPTIANIGSSQSIFSSIG